MKKKAQPSPSERQLDFGYSVKDKAWNISIHLCKYLMLTSFASCCCGFLFLDEPNPLVMWPLSIIIIKRIKIQFELLSLHNAKFNTTEGWFYWFCIGSSVEISCLDTSMVLAVEGTSGLASALALILLLVATCTDLYWCFYIKACFFQDHFCYEIISSLNSNIRFSALAEKHVWELNAPMLTRNCSCQWQQGTVLIPVLCMVFFGCFSLAHLLLKPACVFFLLFLRAGLIKVNLNFLSLFH